MIIPILIRVLRGTILRVVALALLLCPAPAQPAVPGERAVPPGESTDVLIRQLYSPEGKVRYLFFFNPGGHVFEYSFPMKRLIKQGASIQPTLIEELADPKIHNEAALILARIGDRDALPALIDRLPTKEKLTEEEDFVCICDLYALWRLTGQSIGINSKWHFPYKPEVRKEWQAWYESNREYLFTSVDSEMHSWNRGPVSVDQEAKLARKPTDVYRKEHPRVALDEVKLWRNDADYEKRLKDYCFSVILSHALSSREAILSLATIRDPRALSAIHAMCALKDAPIYELVWLLGEKSDPSTLPFLQQLPKSNRTRAELESIESMRLRAIERIRLLERYGDRLKGLPFEVERETLLMRCWDSPKALEELLRYIRDPKYDVFQSDYLHVAGYIDCEPIRACLKELVVGARGEESRTNAHAALARLGEKDSVEFLKKSLAHEQSGVRIAAATGLWRLGRRDGFQTLIELLDIRPIEDASASVTAWCIEREH